MASETRLRVNSNGDISLQRIKDGSGSGSSDRKSIKSPNKASKDGGVGCKASVKYKDGLDKKNSVTFTQPKGNLGVSGNGSRGSLSIKDNASPSRLSPSYQSTPKNGTPILLSPSSID